MTEARRPDPDALLEVARREARGRLKIILGAAPGVGKTYEMLREGAALLATGRDVVVGVVETHGRADTAALLAPFEVLARRSVHHGAHSLEEFDLDAMLARPPEVALIDEFAHSNVPGSRHAKRWQDIEELRDAGIDVLTTLNVQHVESLNDLVASFTRVRVRETVPDACLEDAEIELVDIPPDELIERLKDGKVYVPAEATRALGHFFSKANLSALRELALRRAALAVDRQILAQERLSGAEGAWAAGERLVVAVGDQAGSERLVRAAKRLADALGAEWTVLAVETPRSETLPATGRERIGATMQLAATLGATLVSIAAAGVYEGLATYIVENRATVLVIGKSKRSRWFEWRHRSIVDRLVRRLDGVAIHVLPLGPDHRRPEPAVRAKGLGLHDLAALGLVALTTLFNITLAAAIGPYTISLLYLLPVVAAATLFGLRAAMIASITAALAYNFFFLPPVHTFTIADPQNLVTFLVLLAVGVATSQLAGRLRREANLGARTAAENAAIAAFGQKLAAVGIEAGTALVVCREIGILLDCRTVLLVRGEGGDEIVAAHPGPVELTPVDLAAADWTFAKAEPAGRQTGTLGASDWQFHALRTSEGTLAVLGIEATQRPDPVPAERRTLFATLLGQATLAQERLRLEREARQLAALRQRDTLRATLLSALGHDLKTPLTGVVAAAEALAHTRNDAPEAAALYVEAQKLGRVFDDLVEMTRIETGALAPRREAVDLVEAVAAAVHDLRAELAPLTLELAVPPTLPMVEADPRMLHRILVNLLANTARHAPAGSVVRIVGAHQHGRLTLAIEDRGPGIAPGKEQAIFERFVRLEGSDLTGGTGLGLAIVRGFAEVMGIEVSARNRPGGGASFELGWPASAIRPVAHALELR